MAHNFIGQYQAAYVSLLTGKIKVHLYLNLDSKTRCEFFLFDAEGKSNQWDGDCALVGEYV